MQRDAYIKNEQKILKLIKLNYSEIEANQIYTIFKFRGTLLKLIIIIVGALLLQDVLFYWGLNLGEEVIASGLLKKAKYRGILGLLAIKK